MVRQLAKGVAKLLKNISGAEYSERSHQVEFVGTMKDGKVTKYVICTVQLKNYIPRDIYGEPGYFYERERTRRVRNKDRSWKDVKEIVTYYELSPADKKFIYISYVYHHLDQRQISKLSGIPQPYVYRYIKHMKYKPKYGNTPKSERNIDFIEEIRKSLGLDESVEIEGTVQSPQIEIPEDIDFDKPFHVDPYPSRSEWKVRREKLGLKNGEDWRNTPYDENPGAKQYGDGSTSHRKKVAKQKRREAKRIRNIRKFNLDQNNRYNMSRTNPEGDKNLRQFPDQDPYEKQKKRVEKAKNCKYRWNK